MEQTVPTPEIIPQSTNPEVSVPVEEQKTPPPAPNLNLKKWVPMASIILVILIIVIVLSTVSIKKQTPKPVAATPTPTSTPVPSVNHTLAPYATQSAFLNFETAIDALPGTIQNAVLEDQTLTPPVLDLPLGFSN
ncbi:MAG TPA: hypothetical protein VMR81_05480 [Patescibacteria group bacterium]|nr:hypothetical protein [Patescibacteria group bacterium]